MLFNHRPASITTFEKLSVSPTVYIKKLFFPCGCFKIFPLVLHSFDVKCLAMDLQIFILLELIDVLEFISILNWS